MTRYCPTENRQSALLGFMELKNVTDTFQYIPVEEVLAHIVIRRQNIGL